MSNPYAPPDPTKPRPPRPPAPRQHPPAPRQQPPEPPPQITVEQARAITSGVMWFGLLMLAALLAYSLPWPIQVIAPVVGAVAFWQGVRTIMRARTLKWRGMLVPMLVAGLVLTGFMASGATADLALNWRAKAAYEECRSEAITIGAQDRCLRTYEDAVDPANRLPATD